MLDIKIIIIILFCLYHVILYSVLIIFIKLGIRHIFPRRIYFSDEYKKNKRHFFYNLS